jgi:hypothetical protein
MSETARDLATHLADDVAHDAACELVYRHGTAAFRIIRERVVRHERAAEWPEHAMALRLLTVIERMLGTGVSLPGSR